MVSSFPTHHDRMTKTFEITPQGLFSLAEAAMFGFGHRHETCFDGVMRLAVCLDDFSTQVGVELTQSGASVHATVVGSGEPAVVRRQVARMLSLDHDARDFLNVGQRDSAIRELQATAPGLRPPLFASPYEAAVWAVISSRRAAKQATVVRDRLGAEHGRVVRVAGQDIAALPTPSQLLRVNHVAGLPAPRVPWLHGIARAALDGQLVAADLAALDPSIALRRLQSLQGIGPFYAELILLRACGVTDVLPTNEPRVLALAGELYGLDRPMTVQEFADRAEAWRPWRTWTTVLIRAVTRRRSTLSTVSTPTPTTAQP
jgi:DNA-3-methyladenine glycosylase II